MALHRGPKRHERQPRESRTNLIPIADFPIRHLLSIWLQEAMEQIRYLKMERDVKNGSTRMHIGGKRYCRDWGICIWLNSRRSSLVESSFCFLNKSAWNFALLGGHVKPGEAERLKQQLFMSDRVGSSMIDSSTARMD